ncbi:hypothetical protein N1851_033905 [Merluccius polli]|uniref:Uncharacterized protein n=1 Tax=Merluccius polli TaxID=89951 RepID=A0AA47M0G8_MERPO|nr:hypothetical protein N1851_033905 [Merluccius polli]
MLRAQQEAKERRFQAMQAQQQANNQTFMQLMGTVISALCPGQPHSSSPSPSVSTLLPRSTPGAWSMPQTSVPPQPVSSPIPLPMMPAPPQQHLPQPPPPWPPQHIPQQVI